MWLYLLLFLLLILGVCLAGGFYGSQVILSHPHPSLIPRHPGEYGLDFEEVQFASSDGILLHAWFLRAPSPSSKTILLCHGWGADKADLLGHTVFLSRPGRYNLFYLDFRAHGRSQGRISSLGLLESRDIRAALDYLKNQKDRESRDLGLFGLSLGGAVVLWAAAQEPRVKAVVAESPFSSYEKVVDRYRVMDHPFPYFPFVPMTKLLTRWRLGEDPEPYSPIHHIEKISPRPILLIYGEQDGRIPRWEAEALYEKAHDPKELWIVPGCKHGKIEETVGEVYHNKILEFYRKFL